MVVEKLHTPFTTTSRPGVTVRHGRVNIGVNLDSKKRLDLALEARKGEDKDKDKDDKVFKKSFVPKQCVSKHF